MKTEGRDAARQKALEDAAAEAGGSEAQQDEEELQSAGEGDESEEQEQELTGSRDERMEQVSRSTEESATVEELAAKDEITVEDLRRLPGADGLSDEELLAMWEKETGEGSTGTEAPPKLEGFKLYDAKGNELSDLAGVSIVDLLTGKVQIGYNAMNKEHRKALKDLARVASLGHLRERDLSTLKTERGQALETSRQASARVKELEQYQKLWTYALQSYLQGDDKPLKQLGDAYNKALLNPAPAPATSQGSGDQSAEGQRLYYETIVPRARELATKYKVNEGAVADYISARIQQEPEEFLNWEKIEQIITEETPAAIEEYLATQGSGAQTPSETEQLRKEVGELRAQLANKKIAEVRARRKGLPSGGSRTRKTSSEGEDVVPSSIKTREQAKEWLRS